MRLMQIDDILIQWRGRERLLLDALRDKYNVGDTTDEVITSLWHSLSDTHSNAFIIVANTFLF